MEIEVGGVLFDNDGVLVDSHRQVESAWGQLAAEFDLDIQTLLGELAGVRAVDTLSRYLTPDQAARADARLEDLELELAHTTRPLKGAPDVLNHLDDLSWSIVTSASRRLAEARWRGAGITVPPSTVTADDVSHGKPYPDPYLLAARSLGVDPTDCVVFEDSASGGSAGRAAGSTVIAVGAQPWTFEPWARVNDLTGVQVRLLETGRTLIRIRT
ncbi:MAG: HAD-IA family hydrolase [Acidimicrobiales bacterium]